MFKNVKLILKSVREYKKYALLTPLFMIIEAALECALPFVMSQFVNQIEVTTKNNFVDKYSIICCKSSQLDKSSILISSRKAN